jgi:NAD(P)H-hydrate epimerase
MGQVVLTPHPAELARLLGVTTDEVQADRPEHARRAAERFRAVVVLKGWRSLIARPGQALLVCPTGGPELATAGTGDVLTGAVAGLGASSGGASAAVYVHGLAGTIAGRSAGRAGVVAWDVAESLPLAWERVAAGERDDWLG